MKLIMAGTLFLLWTSIANAQSTFDQQTLSRKVNGLSMTKQSFSSLNRLEEHLHQSEVGIFSKIESLNKGLADWMLSWQTGLTQIKSDRDFSSITAKLAEVDTWVLERYEAYSSINNDGYKIAADIEKKVSELGHLSLGFRYAGFENSSERYYSFLGEYISNLKDLSQQLRSNLNHVAELREKSVAVVKEMLRSYFIDNSIEYTASQAAKIEQIFLRSQVLAPLLAELKRDYSLFNTAFLAGDYYSAEKLESRLVTTCKSYELAIAEHRFSSDSVGHYTDRFRNTCTTAKRDLAEILDLFNNDHAKIVIHLVENEYRPKVADYCKTSNDGLYNCAMFKWVGKISSDAIKLMSKEEIYSLAEAWDMVLKREEI